MEKASGLLSKLLLLLPFFLAGYSMGCPMGTSPAEEQNGGLWEETAHWRVHIPYTSA